MAVKALPSLNFCTRELHRSSACERKTAGNAVIASAHHAGQRALLSDRYGEQRPMATADRSRQFGRRARPRALAANWTDKVSIPGGCNWPAVRFGDQARELTFAASA